MLQLLRLPLFCSSSLKSESAGWFCCRGSWVAFIGMLLVCSISLTLSVCLRVFNYTCRSPARLQIHLNPLPTTRVQAVSFQPLGDLYGALRCSLNECKAREHHLLSLMWFHWCATISWHPQEDPISLHYCIIVVLHSIYLQSKLLNVIVLSAQ